MASEPLSFPVSHPHEPGDSTLLLDSDKGLHTLDKDQEHVWQELTRFYNENEQTIQRAVSSDVASITNLAELNLAIDSFIETINVILDGLVVLGNVHPVLGIAIFAFHSVISLDLTRRDNNRKVVAVKLQMQNMMCTMFQLRKLKHSHVEGMEKEKQRAQLQNLVKAIAQDITKCGSDLNYYMNRKLISKLIKAKIYERRFADHIETFVQRRAELQSIITSYIAAGIDAANVAIADVGHKINILDDKLDSVARAIFRKIDTPRERDALVFIEAHGGAWNCVARDELLLQLLSKAGETLEEGNTPTSLPVGLVRAREVLAIELSQDLKEALAKNQARFEQLLTVQNNNLERISGQIEEHGRKMLDHNMKLDKLVRTSLLILEEGKVIKKAVVPNAAIKLKDPELEQIWNRMVGKIVCGSQPITEGLSQGLRRSVKAKQFVLTFRDYLLTDRSVPNTPFPMVPRDLPPDFLLLLSGAPETQAAHQPNSESDDNTWVLKYIDVAYVRPIVEAIDEDLSGFISVKEANKFALSRPTGWNVLHWIAYWAAGWHINLTNYKDKIYSVLHHMLQAIDSIHPANRAFADYYFNANILRRVEALVRSIKPIPVNTSKDSKLSEMAESMASLQEKRLLANLQEVSFIIKSTSDVRLIAGSSRIETWILPLMHLILNRHLEILKLAQAVVLHPQELDTHLDSLTSIFFVFDERQSHLEAIFRQIYRDVEAQFESYSYGMFLTSFKKDWRSPAHNMLSKYMQPSIQQSEPRSNTQEAQRKPPDLSILSQSKGPVLEFEELGHAPSSPDRVPHPLEGAWVGACATPKFPHGAYKGSYAIAIGPITEDRLAGKGENFCGVIEYEARIKSNESGSPNPATLLIRISWPSKYNHLLCKEKTSGDSDGTNFAYFPFADADTNQETEDIIDKVEVNGSTSDYISGRFYMTKRSPDVFRFRHLLDDSSSDSSWNLARKRWAFATAAVLFQAQRRLGSSTFWRARIDECKRWIELSMRDFYDMDKPATARGYISADEGDEFKLMRAYIHPSIARLTEAITLYYLYDRYLYDVFGAIYCDACNQRIAFIRFTCITCMEEDLSDQIDMCAECIDSSVFNRPNRYIHHPSHSLLRFTRRFHYCQAATIIPEARSRSERVKASFKALEHSTTDSDRKELEKKTSRAPDADKLIKSKPSLTALVCACCGKALTLPCWVCVICATDTLICLDCQSKGKLIPKREGVSSIHLRHHPLLRINQSDEVKTNEPKPNRLDADLVKMEERINDSLSQLEHKIEQNMEARNKELHSRSTVLQERLEKLETKVDQQLGTMTSLLQELLNTMKSPKPVGE
ncbi:hypothetical protein CPB84DRAFT_1957799 [Gymnopilus junonius]|uniref:ZZ-type domain-containing protein n=1 Tax=Gymnopilus junonius TaxID=109634 RepID=A0A9P5P077_GYMJU|nr:hypothetical protein CPB84DRAFT_1957799 [Gymnopilus junonius]